jgi:hypothetical protein
VLHSTSSSRENSKTRSEEDVRLQESQPEHIESLSRTKGRTLGEARYLKKIAETEIEAGTI